jgi:hypothetical protein
MAKPDDTSDDALGATPIPTQFISNGEFIPLPQSRRQRQVEFLITQMADDRAARLGTTRRPARHHPPAVPSIEGGYGGGLHRTQRRLRLQRR